MAVTFMRRKPLIKFATVKSRNKEKKEPTKKIVQFLIISFLMFDMTAYVRSEHE